MTALDHNIRDAIVAYLAAQQGIAAALLFGSAAAERLQPQSDIDLAVLFLHEHVPDGFAPVDMRGDLEQIAGRDVDLVVLNGASPIIAFQAVRYGVLLIAPDRPTYDRFAMRLVSEYADFKRIRRPIEEAMIKRRAL